MQSSHTSFNQISQMILTFCHICFNFLSLRSPFLISMLQLSQIWQGASASWILCPPIISPHFLSLSSFLIQYNVSHSSVLSMPHDWSQTFPQGPLFLLVKNSIQKPNMSIRYIFYYFSIRQIYISSWQIYLEIMHIYSYKYMHNYVYI